MKMLNTTSINFEKSGEEMRRNVEECSISVDKITEEILRRKKIAETQTFFDLSEGKTFSPKLPISCKKTCDGCVVNTSKIGFCVDCRGSHCGTSETSEMRIHQLNEYKPILNKLTRKPPNLKGLV